MLHLAIKAIFAVLIAFLFTLFVAKRPGAGQITRRKLIALFVVGLIISGVMLASDNLYAT
ncbi:hypothetical protein [Alicyclobacillus mengziensis]|uniref:Uncharacterized protein n=1 Tax=Alicyclobacillus mengziensis TaxID=2931921 RepID=A0A9X7VXU0_9BACL|nr:hypothetical protein [Alicyclobacillus mengziensis]QSO47004.1 hypothetical protein JZ786_21735 [Alicyclobacillus mengziensis]